MSDAIKPVLKISLAMIVAYGLGVFASARIISGEVAWKTISLPSVPHASRLMTARIVSRKGCCVMKTVQNLCECLRRQSPTCGSPHDARRLGGFPRLH